MWIVINHAPNLMEICQDRLKLYIGQVAYFLDHGV